jgi:hypothetical protein
MQEKAIKALNKVRNAIRGYDPQEIKKQVATLSAKELESINDIADPYSARRVLSTKDYTWWKAAYDRLSGMNEAKKMKDDPCWDDYEMVGHKMKNGKKVPNCVPKNESVEKAKDRLKKVLDREEEDYENYLNSKGSNK